jgi:hypothetical protein
MRREGWSEPDITQTLTTMRMVFRKEPVRAGYYVSIAGMYHVNFTDAPYFTPLAQPMGLTGPIDAERGFTIINAYSLGFFDHQVHGRPAPLLDGPARGYPEVRFSASGIGQQPPP